MRIFLRIFLILISVNSFAECDFRKESQVISLSGTTTVLFKELGLLPKLNGISVFNPISDKEFSGKVYPGGIFLSQSVLQEMKPFIVTFDESRELKKIFESQKINTLEIKTRNQTPTESIHKTMRLIIPLIQGCESEIANLEAKRILLEKKILDSISAKKEILFFLGEIKSERLPEMIMANDGVVKWLREKGKIVTYPSDLAYVNWSAKILNELPSTILKVGVVDPGKENKKAVTRNQDRINLSYPGSLVPGLSQLEAFLFLFEKVK